MSITGKLGSFTRDDVRASAHGHGPVLVIGALKANDGLYPVGLLLTRAATGKLNPLAVVAAEAFGTGDGTEKTFAATLASALPVEPGTVVITDGVETFADDGCGNLVGDAAGTGTVNYKTAAVSATFNTAVVNTTAITVDYVTKIDAVLDDLVDTDESTSGNVIIHGTCRRDALKLGKTAQIAPSAAVLMLMQGNGIYPIG